MGNRTLFWRAMCDFGVAIRFLLMPAFNIYTCGSAVCHQDHDRGSFIHPQSFITSTIDHLLAYAFVQMSSTACCPQLPCNFLSLRQRHGSSATVSICTIRLTTPFQRQNRAFGLTISLPGLSQRSLLFSPGSATHCALSMATGTSATATLTPLLSAGSRFRPQHILVGLFSPCSSCL